MKCDDLVCLSIGATLEGDNPAGALAGVGVRPPHRNEESLSLVKPV